MDIILYNILVGFCALLLGYIFGSIPNGVLVGKIFYHSDPREAGSKNSGGTNVGRLYGKKAGVIVILLDMLKSMVPTVIVWSVLKFSGLNDLFINSFGEGIWDNGVFFTYLAPMGVAIGHCYPVFSKFKGGKTVAVFCGFGILASWFLLLIGAATFFITLKIKKYVSLSSIMLCIVVSLFSWAIFGLNFVIPETYQNILMNGNGNFLLSGWELATAISFIGILSIIRHHANIARLIKGEERKISWMK